MLLKETERNWSKSNGFIELSFLAGKSTKSSSRHCDEMTVKEGRCLDVVCYQQCSAVITTAQESLPAVLENHPLCSGLN